MLRKDLGYVYVHLSRNKDAVNSFRQAIAAESREVRARSDEDGQNARRDTRRLSQEIERLENAWDVTTFVAQSSDKRTPLAVSPQAPSSASRYDRCPDSEPVLTGLCF
jgi:hypothetical protein